MRVVRIALLWGVPLLALSIVLVLVSVLVLTRQISGFWVWVTLPVAIGVRLLVDRYLNEADNHTYSWFIGRNAEWDVAEALSRHLDDRFYLLNDIELPGHGGNIDHVVVGPSGVHVIETKGDVGDVDATGNRLRVRRFPKDDYLRICKARREALRQYLSEALPGDNRNYPVYAVIVFTRASAVESQGTTQGVCVEDIKGLLRLLDKYASSRRVDELHRAQVFHAIAPCVASASAKFIPVIPAS